MVIELTSDVATSGSRDSISEQALVAAARAGDQQAFGSLILLHERIAVRTALAALGQRADAEDAAQDAFLVAWRRLSGFRGDATFRTWLLTIVWREAVARRRARQRWWRRLIDSVPGDDGRENDRIVERVADTGLNPEELSVARSETRRVVSAISRLSTTLRDTLLLSASGEHSYEEISRVLDVPIGTIKWRVSEARKKVAAALEADHEA